MPIKHKKKEKQETTRKQNKKSAIEILRFFYRDLES